MPTKTPGSKKSRTGSRTARQAHQNIPGLHGLGLVGSGRESRLELRDRLQMPRVVFGRVVNVSERTIAKVEAGTEQAEKLRRPYNEIYRLFTALSEVIDPVTLGQWFLTPLPALDGLKPLEVVERGEADRLWEIVYRLRSGMPG